MIRLACCIWIGLVSVVFATSVHAAPENGPAGATWQLSVINQLCRIYGDARLQSPAESDPQGCLRQIATEIGRRLAAAGPAGVPAEDVAALALLLSRSAASGPAPVLAQATSPGTAREPVAQLQRTEPDDPEIQLSDIGKGQEGYRQGVERLSELPVSERMVVTGDVTAGFQAATVTDAPELTSAFGRARVNFVMRATPASSGGALSEGYFFVQMIAAGGPFDASLVGGPSAFSPFNDVATDRSAFNQPVSRGNLYLKKAFYQQEVTLGDQGSVLGRVGVISLSDFFDTNEFANNEARQFLNAAFVNSPAYKAGIGAPGFMAEYRRPVDLWLVEGLKVRTGYAVSRTFRALTSPIWTNELEVEVKPGGKVGRYRAGATLGNVPDAGGLNGWHLGFDQWLSEDLGLFGRYARSNRGPGSLAVGPVHQSYSLGAQWRLGSDVERLSALGVGLSQAFPLAAPDTLRSERVIEAYFRRQFTANLSLTPDFQLILGSGGSADQGTHVVGSLRVNVGF